MKTLRYLGGSLVIGDAVAHSVLAYARDLARVRSSDTVVIHGLTADGADDEAEMLIGPASQLVTESAEGPESLPGDDAVVAELEARRGRLVSHPIRMEDQQVAQEREWYEEWPTDASSRPD
ncbi:hypothetical protein SAMN06295885_3128 [Rathayibacter oskolensis]|uniref:Uncharacterized protein n=1 Tax=Rathayibacter oskolensis TaxID=1891671 RepID=A0A1X7PC79_9MICO|nr:hypothetical protein [Rathayibacter oskolensis]SMH48823.1 hypothetical protein SAMN06295885_3128 [Rathayibacter oskolensis]